MKIFPLFEGSYSVDISKKFIPFDPAIHNPKDRPGSLFIYVQPFLIKTKNDLILFDTGLGFKNNSGKPIIYDNMENAGFKPEDVSLVLMSHLHSDHAGGMVVEVEGTLNLAFANAEYVIQRGEWESAYSKPSKSYRTEVLDVVQRSGNLVLIEGNGNIKPEISHQLTGGHCEFHQVFWVDDAGEKCFFGGDELPEPEQLLRRFKAKYDFDGQKAMELREKFGKQAAAEDWTCLFYHAKSEATAKVRFENEGLRIVKA